MSDGATVFCRILIKKYLFLHLSLISRLFFRPTESNQVPIKASLFQL